MNSVAPGFGVGGLLEQVPASEIAFRSFVRPESASRGWAAIDTEIANAGLSAVAAGGTSIRHCQQCNRNLTLIWIAKPNGCFSEFLSVGLGPSRTFEWIDRASGSV